MVIPLWVIWTYSRLCGNLFMAKCWFNEFWAREMQHQKPRHTGNKWLKMRALHLRKKKKKNQDKYLSTVLLKDSFSSQTWRNRCKTNMLAAAICVSSFLCSVCQGKKKKRFMTHCFPRMLIPLQIFTGCFLGKLTVYRLPTEFPFLLQGRNITA